MPRQERLDALFMSAETPRLGPGGAAGLDERHDGPGPYGAGRGVRRGVRTGGHRRRAVELRRRGRPARAGRDAVTGRPMAETAAAAGAGGAANAAALAYRL